MRYLLFLFLIFSSNLVIAQVVNISKENPLWGEQVDISYTPSADSQFKLSDEVYLYIAVAMEDYSHLPMTVKMQKEQEKFVSTLQVKEGSASYSLQFRVNQEFDYKVATSFKPISSEGHFYRNAFVQDVFQSPEAHKEELKSYPDNFSVYRTRWQLLGYTKKDSAQIIIKQELDKITQEKVTNETYYYAKVCGHALLGEFDQARSNFETLLEEYPRSPLIADSYTFYNYNLFSQSARDNKISGIVYDFILSNPSSVLAKDNIRLLYKKSKVKDADALKKIAAHWMKEDPDDAMMYYHYARAIEDRQEKLFYLDKSINTLFNGNLEVTKNYNWDSGIVYTLPTIIKGFEEVGAYAQALALLSLLENNSNKLEGDTYIQKGRVLTTLNRDEEAIAAYLMASDMGLEIGLDSARHIYDQLELEEDFESYAEGILKTLFDAETGTSAEDFEVEDLNGNIVSLESLKGKVVVLNFWFIGCAPCIKEIPGLNQLVASYDEEDVVFIAFALDEAESLKQFLAETTFDYQIIPESIVQSSLYKVQSYPTHAIIDKQGMLRSTLVGGSADRHEQIKPLIDRLLKF